MVSFGFVFLSLCWHLFGGVGLLVSITCCFVWWLVWYLLVFVRYFLGFVLVRFFLGVVLGV